MNPEQTSPSAPHRSRFESWSFGILVAVIFLVPIIFIPVPYLQQSAVKGYLVIFGVLISAILYIISRIKAKSFEWIAHPLSYVGIVLFVSLLLSSIWSSNFIKAFFGQGFEYTTAAFSIILIISAGLLAVLVSRRLSRVLLIYTAVIVSFVLLAIFQVVKLINPLAMSFGIFSGTTSTLIGSWNDLGIFSGVILIILSLAFLYFPMRRMIKCAVGVLFVVSFFFLVIVDLPSIWFGIAFIFLALIFQKCINERKKSSFLKRLPVFAIVMFILSAFLYWNGNVISAPIVGALKAEYSEIHLPWQMTLDVGTGIIKSDPILGSGPNTFSKEYLLYKPIEINPTQFWETEFSTGSGLVPTIALSIGLSGIVIFCLLYIYFIREGIRTLRNSGQHRTLANQEITGRSAIEKYIPYSSFFVAAFLLYMCLAYVPLYANFLLTFVFIGIFLGSRIYYGAVSMAEIPFNFKGKPSFYVRSCGIIVLLVLVVGFIYFGMKAVALGYFTAGAANISSSPLPINKITAAKNDFKKSLALDSMDIYDQALAETDLASVNYMANQISSAGQSAKPTDAQIKQISSLLDEASSYAAAAVKIDPSNYYNYISEARVFSAAANLKISGAYDAAITAYNNAANDDPYDPSIYLAMAQLAASQSKYDDATSYIGSALQLKGNYTDAVYLLSQVQVAEGKTLDAITSAKFLTQLNPRDPTAFFELGLLQYNAGEYSDATTSLATAVSLSPDYANAQYFLGLSYSKTGDTTDAIAQFQELAKTNPDNSDVITILANLKAGKDPFANQTPPESTPLKRSSLPVSDQSSTMPKNSSSASSAAE